MAYLFNKEINFEEPFKDAFERIRISQPNPLFSSQFEYDKQPELWAEKLTGTASATHLPNESSINLTVGTTSGSRVIRQSKQYMRYYPGRSQFIVLTGVLGLPKTNVARRIGYYDDRNGFFFQSFDANVSIVKRTFTSGVAVDTTIAQDNWNLDPMNGNGPSGITLDVSKTLIFVFDLQWLGVGRVRCGLDIDGKLYYVHEFKHSNILTEVYITTANLPVRYEIVNTGTTTSSTTLKQICSAVVSEGGPREGGFIRSISRGSSGGVTVGNNTIEPILSIRLKSTHIRSQVYPLTFSMLNTSNSYLRYMVYTNSTLTGASWASASEAVEYDTFSTAISGGILNLDGYLANKESISNASIDNKFFLAADIDGNSDIITLAAAGVGGSATVYGAITWREDR